MIGPIYMYMYYVQSRVHTCNVYTQCISWYNNIHVCMHIQMYTCIYMGLELWTFTCTTEMTVASKMYTCT